MRMAEVVTLQSATGPVNWVAEVIPVDGVRNLPSVEDLWEQIARFAGGAGGVIERAKPNKLSVALTAGFEGKQGWVLGHASLTGQVEITLEWAFKPDPK